MANLTVSNACDIMQAAVTFGQDEMKAQALAFIEQNTAVSNGVLKCTV